MKFRPTEFLNTPYRVSCYIKLYRKLFSCMRPILKLFLVAASGGGGRGAGGLLPGPSPSQRGTAYRAEPQATAQDAQ